MDELCVLQDDVPSFSDIQVLQHEIWDFAGHAPPETKDFPVLVVAKRASRADQCPKICLKLEYAQHVLQHYKNVRKGLAHALQVRWLKHNGHQISAIVKLYLHNVTSVALHMNLTMMQ